KRGAVAASRAQPPFRPFPTVCASTWRILGRKGRLVAGRRAICARDRAGPTGRDLLSAPDGVPARAGTPRGSAGSVPALPPDVVGSPGRDPDGRNGRGLPAASRELAADSPAVVPGRFRNRVGSPKRHGPNASPLPHRDFCDP